MTIFKTLLLSSIAVAAFPPLAYAADMTTPVEQPVMENTTGIYLGSLNSVTFLDNTSFNLGGGATHVKTNYDVGYYSALRAGYNFGTMGFVGARVELEAGYGNSSVDYHRVDGVRAGSIDSFGDATTIQGYVNGYIDIPLASVGEGVLSAFTPYIGGGAGLMNLKLRRQGVSATGTVIDDNDTQFSYHLDVGVGINLQQAGLFTNMSLFDNTTFDIGYRYTAADKFKFEARDGTRSQTDLSSHAGTFGFRRQF